MENLGEVQTNIEPPCPTDSELKVCDLIKKRKLRFEAVMTCAGPSVVQAPKNTVDVYAPQRFEDLNSVVCNAITARILQIWKKKFVKDSRVNNFEVILHGIPYPIGTSYTCRIIFLLKKDGVEFVHPFKGTLDIDLPQQSVL